MVEIYHNERRIALNEYIYTKYGYSTHKNHMPSSYHYISEWNPNRFISWARNIGEHTEHYIAKVLEKKHHPEQSYKSCIGIFHGISRRKVKFSILTILSTVQCYYNR